MVKEYEEHQAIKPKDPVKPKLSIEDRKEIFTARVNSVLILERDRDMVDEFISYWSEHKPSGRKMRFEMEKVFAVKRRFATWKRNAEKFGPSIKNKPLTLAEKLQQNGG